MDLNSMIMFMRNGGSSNSNLRYMLEQLRSTNESEREEALSLLCTELNSSSLPSFVAMNANEIFVELMRCLSNYSNNQMIAVLASRALNSMLDLVPRLSSALGTRDNVKTLLGHIREVTEIDVTEECIMCLERIIHTRPNAQTVLESDGVNCLLSSVDFFIISSQRKAWEVIACCARCVSSSTFELVQPSLHVIRSAITNNDAKLSFKASQTLLRIVTNVRHHTSLLEDAYGNLSEIVMLMLTKPNYDDPMLMVILEIVEVGVTHSVHILQSAFDSGLASTLLHFIGVPTSPNTENTSNTNVMADIPTCHIASNSVTNSTRNNEHKGNCNTVVVGDDDDDEDDEEEKEKEEEEDESDAIMAGNEESHVLLEELHQFSDEMQLLLCGIIASFLPRLRYGVREYIPEVALLECRLPASMYFDPKEFDDKTDKSERESILLARALVEESKCTITPRQSYAECVIGHHSCDGCGVQCTLLNWFRCNTCEDHDYCAACLAQNASHHANGRHAFSDTACVFGYDGVLPHGSSTNGEYVHGASDMERECSSEYNKKSNNNNKSHDNKVLSSTLTSMTVSGAHAKMHNTFNVEEGKKELYHGHVRYLYTIMQALPFVLHCALNTESVLARCHCFDYIYTVASLCSEQQLRQVGWRENEVAAVIMAALTSPFACLQLSAISLTWKVITSFSEKYTIRLIREGVAHAIEQFSLKATNYDYSNNHNTSGNGNINTATTTITNATTHSSHSSHQTTSTTPSSTASSTLRGVIASLTKRSCTSSSSSSSSSSSQTEIGVVLAPHESTIKSTNSLHNSSSKKVSVRSDVPSNTALPPSAPTSSTGNNGFSNVSAAECMAFFSIKVGGKQARTALDWNTLIAFAAKCVLAIFPHHQDNQRTATLHEIVRLFQRNNLAEAFKMMHDVNASELSSFELLSVNFVHELIAALTRANSMEAVMMFVYTILFSGKYNKSTRKEQEEKHKYEQTADESNFTATGNVNRWCTTQLQEVMSGSYKSPLAKFIQSLHSVFEQDDHFDIAHTVVNCIGTNADHAKHTSVNQSVKNDIIYNNNSNSSSIKYKPVVITLLPHEADVTMSASCSGGNNLHKSSASSNVDELETKQTQLFAQKAAAAVPADLFASVFTVRRFVYSTVYPMWMRYRDEYKKQTSETTQIHQTQTTPLKIKQETGQGRKKEEYNTHKSTESKNTVLSKSQIKTTPTNNNNSNTISSCESSLTTITHIQDKFSTSGHHDLHDCKTTDPLSRHHGSENQIKHNCCFSLTSYSNDKEYFSIDPPKKEINMSDELHSNINNVEKRNNNTLHEHEEYLEEEEENESLELLEQEEDDRDDEEEFYIPDEWLDDDDNDEDDDDDDEDLDSSNPAWIESDNEEDETHSDDANEEETRAAGIIARLLRLSREESTHTQHNEHNNNNNDDNRDVNLEEEESHKQEDDKEHQKRREDIEQINTSTAVNKQNKEDNDDDDDDTRQRKANMSALDARKCTSNTVKRDNKPQMYLRLGEYVLPNSMIILELVQLLHDLNNVETTKNIYTNTTMDDSQSKMETKKRANTSSSAHALSSYEIKKESHHHHHHHHHNFLHRNRHDREHIPSYQKRHSRTSEMQQSSEANKNITGSQSRSTNTETVAVSHAEINKNSNNTLPRAAQERTLELYYSDVPFGKEYKPWHARRPFNLNCLCDELRVITPSTDARRECERAVMAQLHNHFVCSNSFLTMQQQDVLTLLSMLREVVHYWKELRVLYPPTLLNTAQHEQLLTENENNAIDHSNHEGNIKNVDLYRSDCLHQLRKAPVRLRDFENIRLNSKVWRQYCNVLTAAQIPGSWAVSLALDCNFLFSHSTRQFLFSVAFCDAFRAAYRIQQELTNKKNKWERLGGSSSNSNAQSLYANYYFARETSELPVLQLQRLKVKVRRDRVLDDAMRLVKEKIVYDHRMFEYEFCDEVGSGSGPTREFYALVARALRQRALQLWRGSDEEEGSEYYTPLNGLYPQPCEPHSAQADKMMEYFEFIGVFVARALIDDQIPVMPLSLVLLKMLRGDECGIEDITQISSALGVTLEAMQHATQTHSNTLTLPGQRKEFTIDEMGLDFVLPGQTQSPIELISNGSNVQVTSANAAKYIDGVVGFMLNIGVRRAVRAMRQGFHRLIPLASLRMLGEHELFEVFNGSERAITIKELEENCTAEHGFTLTCTHVQWFFEIVASFSITEQRNFVMFITGCPHLPVGGMASLRPRLTIVRKTAVADECSEDELLPSVMTCQNYLKMPAYSTKALMEAKLRQAMKEGNGPFLLT